MLKTLQWGTDEAAAAMRGLSNRGEADLDRVEAAVRRIVERVRNEGDAAVRAYAREFESREVDNLIPTGWRGVAQKHPHYDALLRAADRIRAYHLHQREPGFFFEDGDAEAKVRLGMRARPIASVGVYAPGGKARYPSSVLMSAVPAAVAGVPRIVLATPNPTSEILAAAEIAGVHEVVDAGGAQAIGALAYGTESIAAVDKIVGPGNIYVACAKRLVFGKVAIDSIAGPSEVLVAADEHANPAWVAADLLAQAEHDEDAYPLLVARSAAFVARVATALDEQLATLERREIAETALRRHGLAMVVDSRAEMLDVINRLAPEHLCLALEDAAEFEREVEAAGAIFVGHYTPETAGDYAAGPSHVLPTGGAARFSSPLGVYDFVVRRSVIEYSEGALRAQAGLLTELARLEGLEAHARAVTLRLPKSS